jgi:hypothetical protein
MIRAQSSSRLSAAKGSKGYLSLGRRLPGSFYQLPMKSSDVSVLLY